jgi:hypothetical protein
MKNKHKLLVVMQYAGLPSFQREGAKSFYAKILSVVYPDLLKSLPGLAENCFETK